MAHCNYEPRLLPVYVPRRVFKFLYQNLPASQIEYAGMEMLVTVDRIIFVADNTNSNERCSC